ncbi:hypothetical protein [uncultured Litoreibacter sp.]|uniref:hypothetical protein n=1 Tax=uncultured Litoreibacter sp. TaxID=1392394 RepID=UPI002631D99C|nr:hypothetical protein [uncultured Litoreibacter sp.]
MSILFAAVIVVFFLALACIAFVWNFYLIFKPLKQARWRLSHAPVRVSFLLTFAAIVLVWSTLKGNFIAGVINALFPPIVLISVRYEVLFLKFVSGPVAAAGCAALIVFALLVAARGVIRRLSLGIAASLFLVIFLTLVEKKSREIMIAQALEIGATTLERHSFLWSLRNTPREFQLDVHAITQVNGDRYIWSYREQKFVKIPPTIWAEMTNSAEVIRLPAPTRTNE